MHSDSTMVVQILVLLSHSNEVEDSKSPFFSLHLVAEAVDLTKINF